MYIGQRGIACKEKWFGGRQGGFRGGDFRKKVVVGKFLC